MVLFSLFLLLSILLISTLILLHKKKVISNLLPIIDNLLHFSTNSHSLLDWSTELLLTTSTVTISPALVFTADPLNIQHIAKSNFQNYPKVSRFTSDLHDFLGHGIFNVNGNDWKLQRKTASYEFSARSLRAFVVDRVGFEIDHRLFPLLREASRDNVVIDLQDVLERFAFDNICIFVFGYDPDCLYGRRNEEGERFFHAFDEAAQLSVRRTSLPFSLVWRMKKLFLLGSERRLKDSMATVHEFIEGLIQKRRNKDESDANCCRSDFLSRFIEDENNLSDEFIRDILISLILAGRDTTPSALTWFFWLLYSSHPNIKQKILDELKPIRSQRNMEEFTMDELRQMRYLHGAISESMRLYPPVPLVPRDIERDDMLPDGTLVKKGWTVMYSNYAMGRMKKIWGEDCMEFKPERWMDESGEKEAKNVYEYPVFHGGPRMCLGKDMAYVQMKAVAASVVEGFEMEVMEERGKGQLGITLRMEGGLPVRVRERERK